MVSLTRVLCVVALLVLAAGFAGAVHPLGDSLVIFAVPAACLVAVTIWFTGWHWRVILILAFLVVALLAVRLIALADHGDLDDLSEDALVLYQKNMRHIPGDRSDLLADIKASGAGIVTLQEVSEPNAAVLQALSDRMPSQILCPGAPTGGVAVLSSLPRGPEDPVCAGDDRMAALQVMTADGPVWLVSLHLRRPWPQDQARQAERLATRLQTLQGRVIVSGDFNNTHWSYSLRRIGAATNTQRMRPVQPSFTLPYVHIGIAIDHVLVPNDIAGHVTRRPQYASDHRGLVARIGISPP